MGRGLVCGVGTNDLNWSTDRRYHTEYEVRVYRVWYGMLQRCYLKSCGVCNTYYKNVTVCDRWKRLSTFEKDMKLIPGYDLWLRSKSGDKVALDKDIRNPGNKCYQPGCCMFVELKDNMDEMWQRNKDSILRALSSSGKCVICEMSNGEILEFTSAAECARKFSVPPNTVTCSWLNGKSKGYRKYGIKRVYYK